MRRFLPILVLVCGQAACTPGPEPTTGGDVAAATGDFPECPHSWDSVSVFVQERQEVVYPALTGPGPVLRDVPEYHDCQRFVVRDSSGRLAYDSLFAVFASGRMPNLSFEPGGMASPVAEVLAWNAYAPLGLLRGGNCLYMWRDTSSEGPGGRGVLHARMVFTKPWGVGSASATCNDEAAEADLVGTDLGVVESTVEDGQFGPLPPVARWQWDSAKATQSISLRCGPRSWCTVRDLAETGAAPPSYFALLQAHGRPPNPGTPAEVLGRYRIKGWYDEQLLAYADPDTGTPVPTGILGRFFPEVSLGKKVDGDFHPPGPSDPSPSPPAPDPWVLVGYVELQVPAGEPPEHVEKYAETYGLARTIPDAHFDEMNKVYFCEGSQGDCDVPSSVPTCTDDDATESMEWWSKVKTPDGGERIRCVTRRGHPGSSPIPGTARWRWSVSDEGMWERCVQGCCEIIGM